MMRRLISALAAIAVLSPAAVHASSPDALPTLAVLDLTFSAPEEELAATAADSLNAELIATKQFTIVERRKIAHVIREQALGMTGVISDETAIKVGNVVGARLLVIGRVSRIGDLFRIDARMLDSETGKVVSAAHSDFADRTNLDLAVREVVRGLAPTPGSKGDGTPARVGALATPDVVVDPARAKDAAADVARQIGEKFKPVRAHIDTVDESGRATFKTGGLFVFPGLHLSVYGTDSMTGDRELKGYMLVQTVDPGTASGRTTSTTEPCAGGDEAVALPFKAKVRGPSVDGVKALNVAINSLSAFSMDAPDATPIEVQFDLKGAAVGSRHLTVRVYDNSSNLLGTFESASAL